MIKNSIDNAWVLFSLLKNMKGPYLRHVIVLSVFIASLFLNQLFTQLVLDKAVSNSLIGDAGTTSTIYASFNLLYRSNDVINNEDLSEFLEDIIQLQNQINSIIKDPSKELFLNLVGFQRFLLPWFYDNYYLSDEEKNIPSIRDENFSLIFYSNNNLTNQIESPILSFSVLNDLAFKDFARIFTGQLGDSSLLEDAVDVQGIVFTEMTDLPPIDYTTTTITQVHGLNLELNHLLFVNAWKLASPVKFQLDNFVINNRFSWLESDLAYLLRGTNDPNDEEGRLPRVVVVTTFDSILQGIEKWKESSSFNGDVWKNASQWFKNNFHLGDINLIFSREDAVRYVTTQWRLDEWNSFKKELIEAASRTNFMVFWGFDELTHMHEQSSITRVVVLLILSFLMVPFLAMMLIGTYFLVQQLSEAINYHVSRKLISNGASRLQIWSIIISSLILLVISAIIIGIFMLVLLTTAMELMMSTQARAFVSIIFFNEAGKVPSYLIDIVLLMIQGDILNVTILIMSRGVLVLIFFLVLYATFFVYFIRKNIDISLLSQVEALKLLVKSEKTVTSSSGNYSSRKVRLLRVLFVKIPKWFLILAVSSLFVVLLVVLVLAPFMLSKEVRDRVMPLVLLVGILVIVPTTFWLMRSIMLVIYGYVTNLRIDKGDARFLAPFLMLRKRKSYISLYLLFFIIVGQIVLLYGSLHSFQSALDSKENLVVGTDLLIRINVDNRMVGNGSQQEKEAEILTNLSRLEEVKAASLVSVLTMPIKTISVETNNTLFNGTGLFIIIDTDSYFDAITYPPTMVSDSDVQSISQTLTVTIKENHSQGIVPAIVPKLNYWLNVDVSAPMKLRIEPIVQNESFNNISMEFVVNDTFLEWPGLERIASVAGVSPTSFKVDFFRKDSNSTPLYLPTILSRQVLDSNQQLSSLLQVENATSNGLIMQKQTIMLVRFKQYTQTVLKNFRAYLQASFGDSASIIGYRTPEDSPNRITNSFIPILQVQAVILGLIISSLHVLLSLEFLLATRPDFGLTAALGLPKGTTHQSLRILSSILLMLIGFGFFFGALFLIPVNLLIVHVLSPSRLWNPFSIPLDTVLLAIGSISIFLAIAEAISWHIRERPEMLDFVNLIRIIDAE